MSLLQKCCKCKCEQELKYFSNNKKGLLYKTCDKCRLKRSQSSSDKDIISSAIKLMTQATQQLERVVKEDTDTSDIENKPTNVELVSIPSQSDEKYVIVVDVETNGLIGQRGATPTDHNLHLFPNIVQFSWGLFYESGECKEMKDYIIKPNGWTMNGKEEFHGITLERANKEGVDIIEVLKEYKNDIEQYCSKLVSHNLDFDKYVIKSEFIRHDMIINDIGEYCTMKNTIDYCKITPKVRGEYKWPKLEQLYKKCFNEELQNAHNSYYDVKNCAKCYFSIKTRTQDDQPIVDQRVWKEAEEEASAEFEWYIRKMGCSRQEAIKEGNSISYHTDIIYKRKLNEIKNNGL
jgi:DNA polymerase III epsilon subunit-like protein